MGRSSWEGKRCILTQRPTAKFQVLFPNHRGAQDLFKENVTKMLNLNKTTYFSLASFFDTAKLFLAEIFQPNQAKRHPAWKISAQMAETWKS